MFSVASGLADESHMSGADQIRGHDMASPDRRCAFIGASAIAASTPPHQTRCRSSAAQAHPLAAHRGYYKFSNAIHIIEKVCRMAQS
jgi:hypothetical protein